MNITLKQLRYLDAALRTGSIARAAEDMNISQSSITSAIDQIEQTVGAELFRRIPAKGIVATRIGEQTGARVAEFLEQVRVFESDLMSITGDPKGTLRLACYEPTAPYVLPPLLKRISDKYPEIRLDISEGDMQTIDTALRDGRVDVALTYRRETHLDHRFVPLFAARPWALLPDSWPLCNQPSVSFEDLAGEPMILLDVAGTKNYFLGLFSARGLTPNVVHRTQSGAVLRGLVAAHFGYAILNICGPADRDGKAGCVARPFAGEVDSPTFGAAYPAQLEQSAMVRAVSSTGRALVREGRFEHLTLSAD